MPLSPPVRSVEQRVSALALANKVRCHRADVKRSIRTGEQAFADVLRADDPELAGMKVFELLCSVRRIGAGKAQRLMTRNGVALTKTVGGLSARQRTALVGAFSRGTPSVGYHRVELDEWAA